MSEKIGEWLPIDHAPKDGTVFILGSESGDFIPAPGYYCAFLDFKGWWIFGKSYEDKVNPSHFMYLPNNPRFKK